MLKRKTTLGRPLKMTVKARKDAAWDAFSLYIRTKYAYNAGKLLVECYTCGGHKTIDEIQAGHGISGRNNAILFEEKLVRPQCVGCNIFGRGKQAVFTYKLIKELGLKEYEKLVEQSQKVVQYKVADFLAIEEKYKNLLQPIAEDLGGR